MQKVNNPEKETEDFENKALFLRFKDANAEAENYRAQNLGYYQSIDGKQKEIEEAEKGAENLIVSNEADILKLLNTHDNNEGKGIAEKEEENN